MNKEPFPLYLFRLILGFCLVVFIAMLYWSNTLIESNLIEIRSEITELKNQVTSIRSQVEKVDRSSAKPLKNRTIDKKLPQETTSKYPNLLKEDLFYSKTLPKLLGDNFVPHGTQRLATIGKPDNLHPFSNWAQVSSWISLCTVSLAGSEFGKYETLSPDMAYRMEERINLETNLPEYWIFLRDDVYWQPLKQSFFSSDFELSPHFKKRHKVTSADFKFYYDAMINPHVQLPGVLALRSVYSSIESLEVIDDLTFVVRWKAEEVVAENGEKIKRIKYIAKQLTAGLRPLACFLYQYFADGKKIVEEDQDVNTYAKNSVWAENFASHWAKNIIASCGAFTFDGMNERQIKFVRNKDFYEPFAALTESIDIDFKDSPDNIWQAFKSNNLDSFTLQPNQEIEFKDFLNSETYKQQEKMGAGIHRLDYVMRSYAYIAWNEAKPYFNSKKIRQALTLAIDRQRIIEQTLNGMGVEITGTFYRYSPAYDESLIPFPFSPDKAKRLLEEEGWHDSDGDGIRDKIVDGTRIPFSFTLTYFVKSPTSKAICEYISTALKAVGIDCRLNGVDIADISSQFDNKSFDAISLAWSLGTPPEDPRQLWHSSGAKEKGSSNAIGFANKEIDKIIDALDFEYDMKKRVALYHQFDKILYEEQPYTFLYTPKVSFLSRDYLQNVFLPIDRQDLIPGANVAEPASTIFWLK